jgi:hypothetical protein
MKLLIRYVETTASTKMLRDNYMNTHNTRFNPTGQKTCMNVYDIKADRCSTICHACSYAI